MKRYVNIMNNVVDSKKQNRTKNKLRAWKYKISKQKLTNYMISILFTGILSN